MSDFTDNTGAVLRELEEAMKVAAEIIGGMAESHAKELCPVDTGNLRNSISHTCEVKEKEAEIFIGTNVEYAPYVELGTYKMQPRPFLTPAAEDYADEYREVWEKTLKNKNWKQKE